PAGSSLSSTTSYTTLTTGGGSPSPDGRATVPTGKWADLRSFPGPRTSLARSVVLGPIKLVTGKWRGYLWFPRFFVGTKCVKGMILLPTPTASRGRETTGRLIPYPQSP